MKKKAKYLFWIIFVGVVAGLGYIMYTTQAFTVKSIDCVVKDNECSEGITTSLEKFKGRSIFFTDFEVEVKQEILNQHPGLSLVSLDKKLPGKLSLQFSQNLQGLVVQDQAGGFLYIDEYGYVIKDLIPTSQTVAITLPNHVFDRVKGEGFLDREMVAGIWAVAENATQTELEYRRIFINDSGLVLIQLKGGLQAVLSLTEPEKIRRLFQVVKGIDQEELETIREIDLRFKLPVMRDHVTVN